MKTECAEIAHQDDEKNKRNVRLTLHEDGSIEFNTYDSGEAPEQIFGHEEYEFWVRMAGESVPKLAFALLREKFSGNLDATDSAARFCKEAGVEYEWSSYL